MIVYNLLTNFWVMINVHFRIKPNLSITHAIPLSKTASKTDHFLPCASKIPSSTNKYFGQQFIGFLEGIAHFSQALAVGKP